MAVLTQQDVAHPVCPPLSPGTPRPPGPGPGCDFGKHLPYKQTLAGQRTLAAPRAPCTVQKIIQGLGTAKPPGGVWGGSQTRAQLLLPLRTPSPRAVPFLVEHPRAPGMVAKPQQQDPPDSQSRPLLTSAAALGGASQEAPGSHGAGRDTSAQCPHPATLQMLSVLPVAAQRAPGPHPAHPSSPSPPQ